MTTARGLTAAALLAGHLVSAASPCVDLAGRFVAGDGYVGTVLELEADCSAVLEMSSDSGERWEARLGARREGDRVLLPDDGVKGHAPASFVPVRWGPRLYLVPEAGLDAFCDAFNAGAEPSHIPWILRRGAWERVEPRPAQVPEVPPTHRARVLVRPLSSRVVSVNRPERREVVKEGDCEERRTVETALVTVGIGARAGLVPGHVLYASNPRRPSLQARLVVRSLEADRALAEVVDQRIAKVRAGDLVSTRDPRER